MADDDPAALLAQVPARVGEAIAVLTRPAADAEPTIVYVNPALVDLTGLGAESLLGRTLDVLACDRTERPELARLAQAATRALAIDLGLAVRGRDGVVWTRIAGRPLTGADFPYLLRLVDVGAVHAGAADLARLRQLETLDELTADCVYRLRVEPDCRLALEWTAGAFLRLIGYHVDEIEALGGWTALIEPDDLPRVQQRGQRLLAGDEAVVEYRIRTRSGRRLWLRDSARPEWDAGGELVLGALCVARDVSERRELAERLEAHRRDTQGLIALLDGLVLRLEPDGRIRDVSGRARGELAGRLLLAAGRRLEDVMDPAIAAAVRDRARNLAPGWLPPSFEIAHPGSTGEERYRVALAPGADDIVLVLLAFVPGVVPDRGHAALGPHADERLAALLDSQDVASVLLTDELRVKAINRAAEQLAGWQRRAVVGRPFLDLLTPDAGASSLAADLEQARTGVPAITSAARLRRGDGPEVRVVWSYTPLRDTRDRVIGILAQGYLPAPPVAALPAPDDDRQRLRTILDHVADGVLALDEGGAIVDVGRSAEAVFGYRRHEMMGRDVGTLLTAPGHTAADAFAAIMEAVHFPGERREMWARRQGGEIVPVEIAVGRIDHDGAALCVLTVRDITVRKQTEETIRTLAYLDALTGLPNRLLFNDRLSQGIERARRNGRVLAVMSLDLDRFKLINDSLGLASGDEVLRSVGTRLAATLRRSDTVARPGSDDFLILLPGVGGAENAAKVAQKLLDALLVPFPINGQELPLAASVGIALYPHDGESAETLIRNADTALYRAKERSRGSYQFYTTDMNAAAFERLVLETQLRRAIERDELIVCYQPQVSLASGDVVGVEALVRWQHPDLGMVPPSEFIPLAEETGLILGIGRWVLATACAEVRAWQAQGIAGLRLAVNLSGRQLQDEGLVAGVAEALAQSGLDPHDLELELTESTIMQDAEATIDKLQALDQIGIRLSIDDFGTGYSSLSYLKRFPIRSLKIDQSFVRDITSDPNAAAIAQAIVALGGSLRLRVIAEGVETREQLELLRRFHCDEMQGYLFSRPLPPEQLIDLIRHRTRLLS